MTPDAWRQLLKFAYKHAAESHDPSTQNAALLLDEEKGVRAVDINRFPDGVRELEDRWERPLKYSYIEHAERNVYYKAARLGILTKGSTMVCPWAPCDNCARAIIQCGTKMLVTHKQAYDRSPERWKPDIDRAVGMLKEAGVAIVYFDGKVDDTGLVKIRHNGEIWNP